MKMTKREFMKLLGKAYRFPGYYGLNLDSADEILEDRKEDLGVEKLSLKRFFDVLLADASHEEREMIWDFLVDHFELKREEVER